MKAYRVQGDRATQELIRKRRHNLFKRLKEFNDRYEIDIWLTMRMPSGRIYVFATKPEEPVPSEEEIQARQVPVIHKTPADYAAKPKSDPVLEAPPLLPFLNLPFGTISPDTVLSEDEFQARQVPVIHKTPADFAAKPKSDSVLEAPPALPFIDLPFGKSILSSNTVELKPAL
ncbi:hypothetical protein BDV06DRAFT_227086 [Aspergillus oleicola]